MFEYATKELVKNEQENSKVDQGIFMGSRNW